MRFIDLKRGEAFRVPGDDQVYVSAGIDGMYARCVQDGKDWRDPENYLYGVDPLGDVMPVVQLEARQ